MLCQVCRESLIDLSKRVYICKTCSPDADEGDAMYWCKKCKESTEHEHPRVKFTGMQEPEGDGAKPKIIDDLLQEYYDLDCEDTIAGGKVKTRFKYTSVPQEDYGLTPEEILLLDDKQLSKFASVKQLRPYRNIGEDGQPIKEKKKSEFKLNKLKAEIRPELEMRKVSLFNKFY